MHVNGRILLQINDFPVRMASLQTVIYETAYQFIYVRKHVSNGWVYKWNKSDSNSMEMKRIAKVKRHFDLFERHIDAEKLGISLNNSLGIVWTDLEKNRFSWIGFLIDKPKPFSTPSFSRPNATRNGKYLFLFILNRKVKSSISWRMCEYIYLFLGNALSSSMGSGKMIVPRKNTRNEWNPKTPLIFTVLFGSNVSPKNRSNRYFDFNSIWLQRIRDLQRLQVSELQSDGTLINDISRFLERHRRVLFTLRGDYFGTSLSRRFSLGGLGKETIEIFI